MTINNSSGIIAKDRLKNVINLDRTKFFFDNTTLDLMKYDIYKAISKYIKIKEQNVKLVFSNEKNRNNYDAVINANIYIDNLVNCIRKDKDD